MSLNYLQQLPSELYNIIHTFLDIDTFDNFDESLKIVCNYIVNYEYLCILKYPKLHELYKKFSKYYKPLNKYGNAKWRILYENLTEFNKNEDDIIKMSTSDNYSALDSITCMNYNTIIFEFIHVLTIYQHDNSALQFVKYLTQNSDFLLHLENFVILTDDDICTRLKLVELQLKYVFETKETDFEYITLENGDSIREKNFLLGCYLIISDDTLKIESLKDALMHVLKFCNKQGEDTTLMYILIKNSI